MSSMLSAPAVMPATSEESFRPALAPLSVGPLTQAGLAGQRHQRDQARRRHEVGLIERRGHHRAGMRKLHLRDALLELAIRTLDKSYLPSSEGHFGVPTPVRGAQSIGGSRLSSAHAPAHALWF